MGRNMSRALKCRWKKYCPCGGELNNPGFDLIYLNYKHLNCKFEIRMDLFKNGSHKNCAIELINLNAIHTVLVAWNVYGGDNYSSYKG